MIGRTEEPTKHGPLLTTVDGGSYRIEPPESADVAERARLISGVGPLKAPELQKHRHSPQLQDAAYNLVLRASPGSELYASSRSSVIRSVMPGSSIGK